jgi:septum formation protein
MFGVFVENQVNIILASGSSARKYLLNKANVRFACQSHGIREGRLKKELTTEKKTYRTIALTIAKAKALNVAKNSPGSCVIGSDQILVCGERVFNKPRNKKDAIKQLKFLSGKKHQLFSAVCVVINQKILWSCVRVASLKMKLLKTEALKKYFIKLRGNRDYSIGVYRYEIDGGALFDWARGNLETILGMPTQELVLFLKRKKFIEYKKR